MKIPKISEELAEETGWHIGDGSMNLYLRKGKEKGIYQLRGHIEDDKEHYLVRIKQLFEGLYNLKISLREMSSTRVFGFQIWNNELVNFKKSLGLPLGKKWDVLIPKVFLQSRELKIAVIRGIFDTDGSIYLEKKNNKLYPTIYIGTICKSLAEQLEFILKEEGFRVTIYSQLNNLHFKRQRYYKVNIRGVKMFHKFMEEISPKNPKHIRKYHDFLSFKKL